MHYKNGREAKNGDKVVFLQGVGTPYAQPPVAGILYNAVAGNDYCNGSLAPMRGTDPCPNLKECLHLDDYLAVLKAGEEAIAAAAPPAAPESKPAGE